MVIDKSLPEFCQSLESYQAYIEVELSKQELPQADPLAIETSFYLAQKIAYKILDTDSISFQDFMQTALYEPALGYYASGNQKFGAGGDFVTAPEISPLFAESFAQEFANAFKDIESNILELGAGSGAFASDCILALEVLDKLPEQYYILEVSAELQARQKQTIEQKAPHFIERFVWLDELPKDFNGVVFANEVSDAIPVGLTRQLNGELETANVISRDHGFELTWDSLKINSNIAIRGGQLVEDRSMVSAWLQSIINSMDQAVCILVDYGDDETSIYHSARKAGTLQQYYRHHKTTNPLTLVGMQDITSSVDFTQLATVADDNHCQLLGYTTQNMFLMANGIEALAKQKMESLDASDTMVPMKIGQQLKQLLMPDEMGETCKVLAFANNVELDLQGFSLDNRLHKL